MIVGPRMEGSNEYTRWEPNKTGSFFTASNSPLTDSWRSVITS